MIDKKPRARRLGHRLIRYLRWGSGLICLVGALLVLLGGREDRLMQATFLAYYIVRPRFVPLPWRIVVAPMLLTLGVLICIPFKPPTRFWKLGGFAWVIAYLTYMWLLYEAQHTMLIQGFDFRRLIDLPYLFLNSIFVGFVLRLQLNAVWQADVHGLLIGILVSSLAAMIDFYQGPAGADTGSFLRSLAFVFYLPGYLLMAVSTVSVSVNALRWLWWELRGTTHHLERCV